MADGEASCGGILRARFSQITAAGGRSSNQDALNFAQQDNIACFVVSDGVGGAEGGEVASGIVVETIIDHFLEEASFGVRALKSYVDHAVTNVMQRKSTSLRLKNMSATVAAVLIDLENRSALWAHMGDTRVYLFRNGEIQQMTKDHSVVQQFVSAGYCAADQLRTHPNRSTLFAAVGANGESVPDVTQVMTTVDAGDAFLICTDGFWEWITEAEMEQAAASTQSVDEWLQSMNRTVEMAADDSGKSRDNFTAYAVWLVEDQT